MTEKEIVNCLKENRIKGVAFGFLPDEVQEWANNNLQEILVYSRKFGGENSEWLLRGSHSSLHKDSVYALPDSFQLKEDSTNS